MGRLRDKLTYANVMATIAVFIALGGASYAATQLPKNSVGTKQLKKNGVTTAKIKKEAVTAAKVKKGTLTGTQINASTLGTVPAAQNAQSARTADAISAPEPWHEVGAPGEPKFLNGWGNEGSAGQTAAFFKDQEGIVHLRGSVGGGGLPIVFQLPPGYRPAPGTSKHFAVVCLSGCTTNTTSTEIFGPGASPEFEGAVVVSAGGIVVGLDSISFRAES